MRSNAVWTIDVREYPLTINGLYLFRELFTLYDNRRRWESIACTGARSAPSIEKEPYYWIRRFTRFRDRMRRYTSVEPEHKELLELRKAWKSTSRISVLEPTLSWPLPRTSNEVLCCDRTQNAISWVTLEDLPERKSSDPLSRLSELVELIPIKEPTFESCILQAFIRTNTQRNLADYDNELLAPRAHEALSYIANSLDCDAIIDVEGWVFHIIKDKKLIVGSPRHQNKNAKPARLIVGKDDFSRQLSEVYSENCRLGAKY